jgi:hypothetical protein
MARRSDEAIGARGASERARIDASTSYTATYHCMYTRTCRTHAILASRTLLRLSTSLRICISSPLLYSSTRLAILPLYIYCMRVACTHCTQPCISSRMTSIQIRAPRRDFFKTTFRALLRNLKRVRCESECMHDGYGWQ